MVTEESQNHGLFVDSMVLNQLSIHSLPSLPPIKERVIMTTKTKEKKSITPKWKLNQDDYIALLESIDINAKAINNLIHDVKKVKTRLGI